MDTTHQRLQSAASSLHESTAAFSAFLAGLPAERAMLAPPGHWSPAAHVLHVSQVGRELQLGAARAQPS